MCNDADPMRSGRPCPEVAIRPDSVHDAPCSTTRRHSTTSSDSTSFTGDTSFEEAVVPYGTNTPGLEGGVTHTDDVELPKSDDPATTASAATAGQAEEPPTEPADDRRLDTCCHVLCLARSFGPRR